MHKYELLRRVSKKNYKIIINNIPQIKIFIYKKIDKAYLLNSPIE